MSNSEYDVVGVVENASERNQGLRIDGKWFNCSADNALVRASMVGRKVRLHMSVYDKILSVTYLDDEPKQKAKDPGRDIIVREDIERLNEHLAIVRSISPGRAQTSIENESLRLAQTEALCIIAKRLCEEKVVEQMKKISGHHD